MSSNYWFEYGYKLIYAFWLFFNNEEIKKRIENIIYEFWNFRTTPKLPSFTESAAHILRITQNLIIIIPHPPHSHFFLKILNKIKFSTFLLHESRNVFHLHHILKIPHHFIQNDTQKAYYKERRKLQLTWCSS